MKWERVKDKLEPILDKPLRIKFMATEDWNLLAGSTGNTSAIQDGEMLFLLEGDEDEVELISVGRSMTETERKLVELILESFRLSHSKEAAEGTGAALKEPKAAIKEWLLDQLRIGVVEADVPEELAEAFHLHEEKIPFLLHGDYSASRLSLQTEELEKLLVSFFDAELIVIPLLEKEWIILGPVELLEASGEESREDAESLKEALGSICSGLHEMLANEWMGETHLAVQYPIIPAQSLLSTVIGLRETMELGKIYQLGDPIHFPWDLYLEKLLNEIPAGDMSEFIQQIFKADAPPDSDTLAALETFFSLDCNVSETAKKLYIHRNTLLYRLDKFKQETGLDVRNFRDAVQVRIALLLYKVTKRK
ncbi:MULTISPECIES: PucR family transcriptional regulator [Paenibacillus]|uniref:PucR family transcriptional regulator n=1 Tax=Paenibacillus residui TaxID=629724 RepID=A0ABW3DH72_9BACL|nr:helix-turn-helix domain-containing protein [Paenibacillus sp. 32O-W]